MTLPAYDPAAIEARRQQAWREREAFRTPAASDTATAGAGSDAKYIKPSAPFTSGNIHIGHVRSYSIGDAYARFRRARGDDVLFAFGFDAFGLPAEIGAIAGGESPSDWVSRCATHMIGQLQRLGFSFDWERTFLSSDALMYRWSQWLFLTLLEHDLIYHGTGNVDWCDTCQTTLATIQVEDGLCWRCHNPVRLVQRPQWYLRISAYVQENDGRLAELRNWDETSLASQRFVLGRVDGVELDLVAADGRTLTVFTPHADAVHAARFVAISPKHPEVEEWASSMKAQAQLDELRSGGWERSARDAEEIPLVDTGLTVRMHGAATELPVVISPVVDGRFGTTAVLGVPEHDRTDAVIAQRLGEGATAAQPVARLDESAAAAQAVARLDESTTAAQAVARLDESATAAQAAEPSEFAVRPAVRYRANDFSVSRQRSWGTPIPIVYCASCGTVPVAREQLPVVLPTDLKPTGAGNPLAEREDFLHTTCPRCGGPAKRETDTLDCHFDALWLWIPACVPPSEREQPLEHILALPDLRRWLPSERLVAGTDSGNFVFDQRIVTKALRDIGPLAFLADGEPFAGCLFHEMVIRDGRKMSKHLGNVVDPDELLASFGADTVRLAVLYAARPQKSLNWSDSAVQHCHRFLGGLWQYCQARFALSPEPLDDATAYRTEFLRNRLAKWCETAVEKLTEDMEKLEMHAAVRNVMRLFDRIKDFEKRVLERSPELGRENHEALLDALALLMAMLAPFAPHIAEELWLASGRGTPGMDPPWPERTSDAVAAGP
jgi:leucyl-tRNA synthetase